MPPPTAPGPSATWPASRPIKTLGKKKIFFLARADSWGWDIRDGVYAAAKENGAEIVGYDEVSLGTADFTTVLQKVRAAKPDVFICRPVRRATPWRC